MFGGIAVSGNLLCIGYTAARGHLFLVDLEDLQVVSHWNWEGDEGYGDAGGVAMDRDYNIYVADTRNDVVRRFSPFGREGRVYGQRSPDPDARVSVRRDRTGMLDRPRAVAVYGDVLWVACGERWLKRGVQRFQLGGETLPPLRAFSDPEARFGAPRGIDASKAGVFVADTLHGVVQRFWLEGRYVGRIHTALDPEDVSRPIAVLARGEGELLVVDEGDRPGIRQIPLDRPPRDLELGAVIEDPLDLAIDRKGRVLVLDGNGERVHRLHEDLSYDRELFDLREIGFGID